MMKPVNIYLPMSTLCMIEADSIYSRTCNNLSSTPNVKEESEVD